MQQLIEENQRQKEEIHKLKSELSQLRRMIFSARSERYQSSDSQPSQTTLFDLDQPDTSIPEPKPAAKKMAGNTRARKKSVRRSFPPGLKRVETELFPEGVDVTTLTRIGQDETEILAVKPQKFYVLKTIRGRFVDPNDEDRGVLQANIPPRTIERGMVDESVLADLVVDKIQFHIPVYRYVKRIKQSGIDFFSDSQLRKWFAKTAVALMPVYHLLMKDILAQPYIQCDETKMTVLSKLKVNASHRGYMWAICSPVLKAHGFSYDPSRSTRAAEQVTQNYNGILQVDGYVAYENLSKRSNIQLVYCWAHARRKFIDAFGGDPPDDHFYLRKCQLLYQIEIEARDQKMSFEQRRELRQKKSVPILEQIKTWLLEQAAMPSITPKSAIGKAIRYSLNRWEGMCYYTNDGQIEIDNNLVENRIRPIALGRKNYLFAGSRLRKIGECYEINFGRPH